MFRARFAALALSGSLVLASGCASDGCNLFGHGDGCGGGLCGGGGGGGLFSHFHGGSRSSMFNRHQFGDCDCDPGLVGAPVCTDACPIGQGGPILTQPTMPTMPMQPGTFPGIAPTAPPPRVIPVPQAPTIPYMPNH